MAKKKKKAAKINKNPANGKGATYITCSAQNLKWILEQQIRTGQSFSHVADACIAAGIHGKKPVIAKKVTAAEKRVAAAGERRVKALKDLEQKLGGVKKPEAKKAKAKKKAVKQPATTTAATATEAPADGAQLQ